MTSAVVMGRRGSQKSQKQMYRVTQKVSDPGWVDLVLIFSSYLLGKWVAMVVVVARQSGEVPKLSLNPTQV